MAQATYSFLDVAALAEVRERFAAGDALAIMSADLAEVIWANGPGAALFGHADVETIFGADAPLGAAARRQIASLSGFPDIGRDRPLLVRVTLGVSSAAERFLASAVTLPDGEKGILLAQPAADGSRGEALAAATGGFAQAGHFVAFIDRAGAAEAATAGFERLGLDGAALAELAAEASDERRIVKRMLSGRRGPLPAGLARLTADRHLLVVIDENWADAETAEPAHAGETAPPVEEAAGPAHEIWHLGSEHFVEAEDVGAEPATEAMPEPESAAAAPSPFEEKEIGAPVAEAGPEAETVADEAARVTQTAADESAAEETAPARPEPAGEATGMADVAPERETAPVRFVWRTDAEGKFSQISPDFARAVGEAAADVVGRRFQDVANAFGLDPSGEIAGLLARRDTWSGRSVQWPVAGTDLRIPVDLAALPVYDRNRNFEGFRGFGVARAGDATTDPEGIGLALTGVPLAAEPEPAGTHATEAEPVATETRAEAPHAEAEEPAETASQVPADPFRGEKPAIAVTPAPDRRSTDKIIRLAEHRPPAPERAPAAGGEKVLSIGERIAFQQIGERLRQENGAGPAEAGRKDEAIEAKNGAAAASPPEAAPAAEFPVEKEPIAQAELSVEEKAGALPGEPDEDADDSEAVAELRALDGATEGEVAAAAAAEATGKEDARPRKRPGMSLLDFAEWGKEESAETDSAEAQPEAEVAAQVEMEEAAALDEAAGAAPIATATDDDAPFAEADMEPFDPAVESAIDLRDAGETARTETRKAAEPGLPILEKLPVPVLVHSGDVLHYANGEFFALTGYGSIEELAEAGGIGALFADAYEDDADQEPKKKTDRHLRLKTKGGAEFPVEAFLQSVPWGDGKALVLVLSRPREGFGGQSPLIAELEARVAEMRTIIDTATDGVVLISRDGDIRSISRPAEALFGIDSDEVAGKPFASLFAIESQKAARDYLSGLTDHGVASVLNDGREVIGREAQGRFIPLFMTIGKLPENSGYCAVVRDITQWKRAEEELTQARATAERASSHKSEFLARVSHEIRTPLNAIIGFSELMLDEKFGPVANDRYRDYLRDINRSGNHVLDLVNDLLDISKIEAGQQEMSYEAVSLNETLAETVAMMQPQANRERVIIRSSFASKLPDVVADLRSVRQIALNVLSNAVRYTQAGGQVIVSTAYEPDGEVVMRVRDTGVGMTPAEIEQALKPFKQINALKRTRGDGTGLGLPLTKAMVEANRAKFSIHSTPGEGTLVEVAFPPTRVLAD